MIGEKGFYPCTPASVMRLLAEYGVELSGKSCVIVGRSNIVGKPLAMLMLRENATDVYKRQVPRRLPVQLGVL